MVHWNPPRFSILLAYIACLLSLSSWTLADEQAFDCHRVTTESGAEFDLSQLAGAHTAERTVQSPPTKNLFTLKYDLCNDLEQDKDCGKGARACLTIKNQKDGESDRIVSVVTLAESSSNYTTHASLEDPKSLNVVFNGPDYPHHSDSTLTPQKFDITILCSPDSTADPKFLSYDGKTLKLEWSAPGGCPKTTETQPPKDDDKNKDGDGSGGESREERVGSGLGWFFLVILLAFVAYFGLGAYYNYSTYGARGIDLIPHRDFWQEVPYMLKDVVSHLCSSVQPRRSSRGGYVAV
ncbi:hypothetical protein NP233_g6544 [Leucocoprinus birnbaumii]|uniref:Autophagy-related protein 27 n=1 Tax=Leucocoprinus birnbaumii TaxID=56174 RepID=A0AAD5VRX1_9AGAR|nr:hypothetical protein NP233_g6544 [Leucocoprinus birnbaumii]